MKTISPINSIASTTITCGTAFSGIGAFEEAMKQLNIAHENCFMIEIDPHAQKTYLANHTVNHVYTDITTVNPTQLEHVDIFAFGSPCQSFSIQGKREGLEDTRGTLIFYGLQIIQQTQPKCFIFENVKGMLTHDQGNTFRTIKKAFDTLNYTISFQVLNAKDFGCPQNRERLFVVGVRKDIKQRFSFPQPCGSKVSVNDVIQEGGYSKSHLFDTQHIVPLAPNPKTPIKIVAECSHLKFASDKRICSTEGISPCLTKGGSKTKFYDTKNKVYRYLSEREMTAIQGFGEDFIFPVSKTHIKEQLGNSMAIPVMKALIENLIPVCASNHTMGEELQYAA